MEEAIFRSMDRCLEALGRGATGTTLVGIIESNFGGYVLSTRIATLMQRYKANVMQFSVDSKKRPGVTTTKEGKERMRLSMQTLLRNRNVRFADTFKSQTPGMKQALVAQLRQYRYETKQAPDLFFGTNKTTLTGKSHGKNDDLAICTQMLAFWPGLAMDEPRRYLVNGNNCM